MEYLVFKYFATLAVLRYCRTGLNVWHKYRSALLHTWLPVKRLLFTFSFPFLFFFLLKQKRANPHTKTRKLSRASSLRDFHEMICIFPLSSPPVITFNSIPQLTLNRGIFSGFVCFLFVCCDGSFVSLFCLFMVWGFFFHVCVFMVSQH